MCYFLGCVNGLFDEGRIVGVFSHFCQNGSDITKSISFAIIICYFLGDGNGLFDEGKIVGVFAYGLDETWLGKTLNKKTLDEIRQLGNKYSINMAGEGGEFETLTINGPIYRKKLILDETIKDWKRDYGILRVIKSHLGNLNKDYDDSYSNEPRE